MNIKISLVPGGLQEFHNVLTLLLQILVLKGMSGVLAGAQIGNFRALLPHCKSGK